MSKALLVISSLAPSGPARQLALAARALAPGGARVVVLGPPTPWSESLARDGVSVTALGWTRTIDLGPARALRALVRAERPDMVHAWSAGAARALLLTGACRPAQLAVSGALPPGGRVSPATRWLLGWCARVLAFGRAEAERYRRLGVAAERLRVVPPGVLVAEEGQQARPPGLAAETRVVLCVGPLARHKGQREAVWAFDIVRPIDDRLRLVIVGTGPGEGRVRRFIAGVGSGGFVHMTGPVEDPGGWLRHAELVWVPSLEEGGRMVTLEAMAAGRAVITSNLPGLAELVAHGETGLLVPPDDKLALARAARELLEDEPRRRRMGEAARARARTRFPLSETIRALQEVYRGAS